MYVETVELATAKAEAEDEDEMRVVDGR